MTQNIEKNVKANLANIAKMREMDSAAKSKDKLSAKVVVEKNPLELVEKLDGKISNYWIPYAVKKNARLFAGKVDKEKFIATIRRLNPDNAEYLIQEAEKRLNEK